MPPLQFLLFCWSFEWSMVHGGYSFFSFSCLYCYSAVLQSTLAILSCWALLSMVRYKLNQSSCPSEYWAAAIKPLITSLNESKCPLHTLVHKWIAYIWQYFCVSIASWKISGIWLDKRELVCAWGVNWEVQTSRCLNVLWLQCNWHGFKLVIPETKQPLAPQGLTFLYWTDVLRLGLVTRSLFLTSLSLTLNVFLTSVCALFFRP